MGRFLHGFADELIKLAAAPAGLGGLMGAAQAQPGAPAQQPAPAPAAPAPPKPLATGGVPPPVSVQSSGKPAGPNPYLVGPAAGKGPQRMEYGSNQSASGGYRPPVARGPQMTDIAAGSAPKPAVGGAGAPARKPGLAENDRKPGEGLFDYMGRKGQEMPKVPQAQGNAPMAGPDPVDARRGPSAGGPGGPATKEPPNLTPPGSR